MGFLPTTQNGVKREANRIFSWGCVSGLCMEHVSPVFGEHVNSVADTHLEFPAN